MTPLFPYYHLSLKIFYTFPHFLEKRPYNVVNLSSFEIFSRDFYVSRIPFQTNSFLLVLLTFLTHLEDDDSIPEQTTLLNLLYPFFLDSLAN